MRNGIEKKRIVAVIPTLDKGGAERILIHFVNHADHEKYELFIFCLKKKGELLSEVDPRVKVIDINYPRLYFSIFRIRKEIRRISPNVVIGWLGNVNAVLAFYRPLLPRNVVLMCRESSIPSLWIPYYRLPFLFRFLYRFYNRFDGIISQSEGMKKDLVDNFKVEASRIRTIYNPVVQPAKPYIMDEATQQFIAGAGKLVLFVGRFSPEKQVNLIIDTFKHLPSSFRLLLVGYGPLENDIREQIQTESLGEQIVIVNNCSNPAVFYQRAACLVLTSSFEGFPNVLLEANAAGCPVVVYKTQGGAAEIVGSETGIYISPEDAGGLEKLVSTVEAVSNGTLYFNRENIMKITEKRFNVQKIVSSYLAYIEETTNRARL